MSVRLRRSHRGRIRAASWLIASSLVARTAWGLPAAGAQAPDARVESVEGVPHDPAELRGRLVLVFYEDRGSRHQNDALKDELHRMHLQNAIDPSMTMFPVADVRGYASWPWRGVARSKVRAEGKRFGLDIYCDWNGSFGDAFQVVRHASNVVLIAPDGRVLYASSGPVSAAQKSELTGLVRRRQADRTHCAVPYTETRARHRAWQSADRL